MNKTFIIFLSLFCGISSFGHSEARYLDVLYGARFTGMDPLAEESHMITNLQKHISMKGRFHGKMPL